MAKDMLVCEQTVGQSVYQHGFSVKEHVFQIIDYLSNNSELDGWKIPKWLDCYKKQILCSTWNKEIITLYTLYHDCGKPYCRTVDLEGKVHFSDHANVSKQVWLSVSPENEDSFTVGRLIGEDMFLHTANATEVKEKLLNSDKRDMITLLIVALAEIHSNAKLFGGIESTSFKSKWKKLDRRGKQICKHYFGEKNE